MADEGQMVTQPAGENGNLELILDVPLGVSVELGRVRMPVRQLLSLTAGSVIELAKLAGEPLDVLINGRPVARGEAVMVNDKFGVRLTEIVSQSERVERLQMNPATSSAAPEIAWPAIAAVVLLTALATAGALVAQRPRPAPDGDQPHQGGRHALARRQALRRDRRGGSAALSPRPHRRGRVSARLRASVWRWRGEGGCERQRRRGRCSARGDRAELAIATLAQRAPAALALGVGDCGGRCWSRWSPARGAGHCRSSSAATAPTVSRRACSSCCSSRCSRSRPRS